MAKGCRFKPRPDAAPVGDDDNHPALRLQDAPYLTQQGLHAFASDDVYSVGGGVYHWDGTSWSWVEDFGELQGEHGGVSLTAVDAVSDCELWTAGREVSAGQIVPFTARHGDAEPVWTDLGGGTPGISGIPTLTGTGDLTGGSTAALSLVNAPPHGLLLAWISFSSFPFSPFGGTIHANPHAIEFMALSDASGEYSVSTAWPTGVPSGTSVWFQFLLGDSSVPWGITLSNGLLASTP